MITILFYIFIVVFTVDSVILLGLISKKLVSSKEDGPKIMMEIRNVFFSPWTGLGVISFLCCLFYCIYVLAF